METIDCIIDERSHHITDKVSEDIVKPNVGSSSRRHIVPESTQIWLLQKWAKRSSVGRAECNDAE